MDGLQLVGGGKLVAFQIGDLQTEIGLIPHLIPHIDQAAGKDLLDHSSLGYPFLHTGIEEIIPQRAFDPIPLPHGGHLRLVEAEGDQPIENGAVKLGLAEACEVAEVAVIRVVELAVQ